MQVEDQNQIASPASPEATPPPSGAAAATPETAPTAATELPVRRQRGPAKPALVGMTLAELESFLTELGQSAFRAKQLYEWIFVELVESFDRMTNLPKALRTLLAERATITGAAPVAEAVSQDGHTTKVLMGLHDGNTVETVLMDYDPVDGRTRHSVCVSSQAGCAVACPFCATGQSGFVRNLTAAEIVEQVLFFARRCRAAGNLEPDEHPITNIVFMGQGEPFANFDAVWQAIEILNSPYGFRLGARHMTVSTSGVVPRIREFAQKPLQVGLAISLHAPNDELRNVLVPLNKKWRVAELIAACRDYVETTHRRITFEYVMLDGINDSLACARELAELLEGMLCHVNLIPMNPTDDATYRAPQRSRIVAFQRVLTDHGILATVRVERGVDIDAACGQLRVRVGREEGWASAAQKAREQFGNRATTEEKVAHDDETSGQAEEPAASPPRRIVSRTAGKRPLFLTRPPAARPGPVRLAADDDYEAAEELPDDEDEGFVSADELEPEEPLRPAPVRHAEGRDAARPWREAPRPHPRAGEPAARRESPQREEWRPPRGGQGGPSRGFGERDRPAGGFRPTPRGENRFDEPRPSRGEGRFDESRPPRERGGYERREGGPPRSGGPGPAPRGGGFGSRGGGFGDRGPRQAEPRGFRDQDERGGFSRERDSRFGPAPRERDQRDFGRGGRTEERGFGRGRDDERGFGRGGRGEERGGGGPGRDFGGGRAGGRSFGERGGYGERPASRFGGPFGGERGGFGGPRRSNKPQPPFYFRPSRPGTRPRREDEGEFEGEPRRGGGGGGGGGENRFRPAGFGGRAPSFGRPGGAPRPFGRPGGGRPHRDDEGDRGGGERPGGYGGRGGGFGGPPRSGGAGGRGSTGPRGGRPGGGPGGRHGGPAGDRRGPGRPRPR